MRYEDRNTGRTACEDTGRMHGKRSNDCWPQAAARDRQGRSQREPGPCWHLDLELLDSKHLRINLLFKPPSLCDMCCRSPRKRIIQLTEGVLRKVWVPSLYARFHFPVGSRRSFGRRGGKGSGCRTARPEVGAADRGGEDSFGKEQRNLRQLGVAGRLWSGHLPVQISSSPISCAVGISPSAAPLPSAGVSAATAAAAAAATACSAASSSPAAASRHGAVHLA